MEEENPGTHRPASIHESGFKTKQNMKAESQSHSADGSRIAPSVDAVCWGCARYSPTNKV